jgi:hypothetical protein
MDRRLMVKQWVGEILAEHGAKFRVFTTGDDRWYLFDPIGPDGCSGCVSFPVLKSRLKPGVIPQGLGRALRALQAATP